MKYRFLGTSNNGKYEYYEASDGYVYQFLNGKSIGWICSGPAWERTMHKCLDAA